MQNLSIKSTSLSFFTLFVLILFSGCQSARQQESTSFNGIIKSLQNLDPPVGEDQGIEDWQFFYAECATRFATELDGSENIEESIRDFVASYNSQDEAGKFLWYCAGYPATSPGPFGNSLTPDGSAYQRHMYIENLIAREIVNSTLRGEFDFASYTRMLIWSRNPLGSRNSSEGTIIPLQNIFTMAEVLDRDISQLPQVRLGWNMRNFLFLCYVTSRQDLVRDLNEENFISRFRSWHEWINANIESMRSIEGGYGWRLDDGSEAFHINVPENPFDNWDALWSPSVMGFSQVESIFLEPINPFSP